MSLSREAGEVVLDVSGLSVDIDRRDRSGSSSRSISVENVALSINEELREVPVHSLTEETLRTRFEESEDSANVGTSSALK